MTDEDAALRPSVPGMACLPAPNSSRAPSDAASVAALADCQCWTLALMPMTLRHAGDYRYCGEPIFVQRQGAEAEDDGYVLVIVNDISDPALRGTALEILNAQNIEAGPVAVIDLGDGMPPGLQGSWTERLLERLPSEPLPYAHDIRDGLTQA
jgi:Retinal pigment epithelial membrane protein